MSIPIPANGPLPDFPDPDASAEPTLRVSGPGEVLQVVPYVLGFHPERSVVLVAFRDRRVVVSARYDLQAPPELSLAWMLAARDEGATDILIVLYADEFVGHPLPHADYADRLRELAAAHDLEVRDRLAVGSERWWSYDCSDPPCCPPEGTPIDRAGVAAVGAVAEGLLTLPRRSDLVAELTPLPEATAAVALGMGSPEARDTAEEAEQRAGDWAVVRRFVRRSRRREGPIPADEAAAVLWALVDVHVRDAALGYLVGPPDPRIAGAWRELTCTAPKPWRAPVATLLAFWCFAAGDGARTNVAVDAALAADPDYSLAQLLDEVVAAGVNPRRFIPDVARECRPIARRIERRRPPV